MTPAIREWGNNLALRLPKTLAHEGHITEGTRVALVRAATADAEDTDTAHGRDRGELAG